jgi:outer membrane protein assembly factor BamB
MPMQLSAQTLIRWAMCLLAAALLQACAGSEKVKPTSLEPNPSQIAVRQVWKASMGPSLSRLEIRAVDSHIFAASEKGIVLGINAETGLESWRANVASLLSAGVGSDGKYVAVVSQENYVIVLASGKELWRQKLNAVTLTAPLVAGSRVFVMTANRTVYAFDALSGRKLWQQQRPSDSLILGQASVLMAVGDTLVTGQSGRLIALNPLNGSVRWDAGVATGRGVNEVERLVDLVAGVSRHADNVCLRAFQTAVACVDVQAGRTLWSKPASGSTGITGNADTIFGTESDGKVVAWRRADGERLWSVERLRFRELSTPLWMGQSVAVADFEGYIHLLSAKDGSLMSRIATDGSPIVGSPVLVGDTLVVVTQRGGIFGFRPE